MKTFTVIKEEKISFDIDILFNLYSPLIGCKAISLYIFLYNLLDNRYISEKYSFDYLCNFLSISIIDINKSLDMLGALGLLSIMEKNDHYLLKIENSFDPNSFFENILLSSFLYEKLGKDYFEMLTKKYSVKSYDYLDYKNITKTFNETFEVNPSKIKHKEMAKRYKKASFNIEFNYDYIKETLKEIIKDEYKNDIVELSYIYNFDEDEMLKLIKSSIDENGLMNIEILKENCKIKKEFEQPGENEISYKLSQKEKLIHNFKTINPMDFLKMKNGKSLNRQEINIIETLLKEYGFKEEVVNVLISYVLQISSNKFNKSYIEAIASQWKRAKIKTVEEAMEFATSEYKKFNKKKEIKEKKSNITPSWVSDEEEKELIENSSNYLKSMLEE